MIAEDIISQLPRIQKFESWQLLSVDYEKTSLSKFFF